MPKTVNLKKALVIIKQLTGDIAKANTLLRASNSQHTKSTEKDLAETLKTYRLNIEQLIEVKTQLSIANVSIYEKIARSSEIKGLISFYDSLDTTSTFSKMVRQPEGGYIDVDTPTILNINEETRTNEIKTLKAELETLLDEIDAYNYNTTITLSF